MPHHQRILTLALAFLFLGPVTAALSEAAARESATEAVPPPLLPATAERPLKVTIYSRARLTRPTYIEDGFIELENGEIIYWNGWYFPETSLEALSPAPRQTLETFRAALDQTITALLGEEPLTPRGRLGTKAGWMIGSEYRNMDEAQLLAAFDVHYLQPAIAFISRGIYGSQTRNTLEFGADALGARLAFADPKGGSNFRQGSIQLEFRRGN